MHRADGAQVGDARKRTEPVWMRAQQRQYEPRQSMTYLTTDAERERMQRDPWFRPVPDAVPLNEHGGWRSGLAGWIKGAAVYWQPAGA